MTKSGCQRKEPGYRVRAQLRAWLHGDRIALLGGSPYQKSQNIALLYMQTRQAKVTRG